MTNRRTPETTRAASDGPWWYECWVNPLYDARVDLLRPFSDSV